MLRFAVGADDLSRSRFALSPVFELDGLLRALAGLSSHRLPPAWVARRRPPFRRLLATTDLAAALALQSRRHGPAFLAVPPHGLAQTWSDDLATVRATPLEVARAEIADCLTRRPCRDPAVRTVLAADDVVDRLAVVLDVAWHELLADDWPQLRAICERDVLHRAEQLGRTGWAGALDGLHPGVRWRDGGIDIRGAERTVPLAGAGLLLIPSVFVWPSVAVHADDPWPRALIYPARGSAALWETRPASSTGALADLFGTTRARILLALTDPATTSQLAAELGISVGGVGDHLAVLLRAGLVHRDRAGRSVRYRRTPLGDAVTSAPAD